MRDSRRARRAGSGMPTRVEQLRRASRRASAAPTARCARIASAICVADAVHRVEAGHRLLEDHRDLVAAQSSQLLPRRGATRSPRAVAAANMTAPADDAAAGLGQQPHDRQAGHRLARAAIRRPCASVSPRATVEATRRRPRGPAASGVAISACQAVDAQHASVGIAAAARGRGSDGVDQPRSSGAAVAAARVEGVAQRVAQRVDRRGW